MEDRKTQPTGLEPPAVPQDTAGAVLLPRPGAQPSPLGVTPLPRHNTVGAPPSSYQRPVPHSFLHQQEQANAPLSNTAPAITNTAPVTDNTIPAIANAVPTITNTVPTIATAAPSAEATATPAAIDARGIVQNIFRHVDEQTADAPGKQASFAGGRTSQSDPYAAVPSPVPKRFVGGHHVSNQENTEGDAYSFG